MWLVRPAVSKVGASRNSANGASSASTAIARCVLCSLRLSNIDGNVARCVHAAKPRTRFILGSMRFAFAVSSVPDSLSHCPHHASARRTVDVREPSNWPCESRSGWECPMFSSGSMGWDSGSSVGQPPGTGPATRYSDGSGDKSTGDTDNRSFTACCPILCPIRTDGTQRTDSRHLGLARVAAWGCPIPFLRETENGSGLEGTRPDGPVPPGVSSHRHLAPRSDTPARSVNADGQRGAGSGVPYVRRDTTSGV